VAHSTGIPRSLEPIDTIGGRARDWPAHWRARRSPRRRL